MSQRPLIGITTYGCDERGRYTLPSDYVAAVERAGALPVLIPPLAEHAERYLARVDGVVLAGGGDIDPARYGGKPNELIYNVDAGRDALEIALARALVERGVPTLAICRGLQVLNVAHGGTLIEHLPAEVGEAVAHRAPPREPVPHAVSIVPGTLLASITGAMEISPLSWHHQAVRALAPGFTVTARAPDGAIEALERPGHPWLVAVQWHPELSAAREPSQQALFDGLVSAVRNHPARPKK